MIFLCGDTEGQSQKSDFSLYFLNKDISISFEDIDMKLSMVLRNTYIEGRVSQNFCLGPSFYSMLFRK